MPDVSVVIPTYQRPDRLAAAIAAARQPRTEVIVVDDGSDPPAVVPDGVRLLRIDSAERAVARNTGLDLAGADLVLFCDDDDRLRPDALATLRGALERHQDAVAAVGARAVRGARIAHPARPLVRDVRDELLAGWGIVPGQLLIRAAVVRALGGFDPSTVGVEDRDLWLRLAERGPFAFVPEVVLDYDAVPLHSRPADMEHARRALFQRAGGGRRLLHAGALIRAGEAALEERRWGTALVRLAGGGALAPELIRSPVMGPRVLHAGLRAATRGRWGR